MEQMPLYAAVLEAGFEVAEFCDHPRAFGSWYLIVFRESVRRRFVYDGKEAFLSFEVAQDKDWKEVRFHRARFDSQREIIARSKEWLLETNDA